jgi:2-oxoglutarate dehydrogenase complex dehydrogenase (E1) component-like enzyme
MTNYVSSQVSHDMNKTESFPNATNLAFVEGLYVDFLRDPSLVPSDWRQYFEKFFKEEEVVASRGLIPPSVLRVSSTRLLRPAWMVPLWGG